jgi:hypothetical protein
VGEDRGSKETNGCPLTATKLAESSSIDILMRNIDDRKKVRVV